MDVAGVIYEIDPSRAEAGAKRASSALDALERKTDAFVAKMKNLQKQVADAFSFSAGASGTTQRFNRQEADFQKYQNRLKQIAFQNASSLNEIEAKRLSAISVLRERFAQREFERQRREAEKLAKLQQGGRFGAFLRNSSLIREAGESLGNAGTGLTLLTGQFLKLGAAAVRSAFDIDKNVNTLKAFLGSSQAAEDRLKQLTALSQKTPGLTTRLASTLDAQLRTSNVSQSTIDRILPSIGRLNAVSPLGDPQKFAQNLQQLITQGFERADLKELVGQSPIAGQILQQLFNVDSPTNGKAIRESAKKMGIRTTDDFFKAFAEAAANNRALAGVTESLESRFQKLADRISIALRPLGLSIVKAFEPIVEKAIPLIEKLSAKFDALPESTKTAIVGFTAVAAAIGPVLIAVGSLVQSIGAIGDLFKAISAISSVCAGTGIAASLGGIATVLGVITVAVGALAAAWYANFGDIRGITNDVAKEIKAAFTELRNFWAEIAPDFREVITPILKGVADIFRFYSELYGAVWRGAWDIVKNTVREALDVLKPLIRGGLALLRGDFDTFKTEALRVWKEGWDAIVTIPTRAFSSLVEVIESGLKTLLTNTGLARSIGIEIGDSLVQGILDKFIAFAASPSTAAFIRTALNRIRDGGATRDAEREAARVASQGKGLDGEEVTFGQLAQNKAVVFAPQQKRLGGGSLDKEKKSAESTARQLRAAEESLAKAHADALATIEERRLQSLLKQEQDNYDKRLIGAQSFFEKRKKIELELLAIEERRIKGEAAASASRLNAAKDGSPEALREIGQLVELQAKLRVIEIDRKDKLRDLNEELLKNVEAERERNKELLASGAALGLNAVKKFNENYFAQQDAKRDRPETDLRIEETRLQALGNAGLIREQELTDALILTRRKYREELVLAAKARKEQVLADEENAGRFAAADRIDEEIASLQTLGSELTRAEALQKRFTEQGIIHYDRLNEGVEDLLASQKGLTEIFSDFRANLVADQFNLIDQGVDALTKRLGVLGNALGQLLKDLAKLALSKIFQKLLGVGGGNAPQLAFGGGGGGQQGGGFNPLSFLTGGGGSGGGNFLTGGFAGGNPAQQALGGSGGGGSILQQITGGGQSGGLRGLLGKIPGIGKLFGAGGASASGSPGGVPIFTQGGGGEIGIAGSAAPSAFGGLAAGGLLAGGGLLGSLAGGKSPIGRLLGGVGGTLLGGALGASGLLGGGIAGALPALFSNPFTAIIGAGLIGGALLARWIGGREQRKFRKTVEDEYQLKVDGKARGTELYKSVKALGEETFGKGKFGKNMLETIRLQKGQEILAAYGEASGQQNNPLVMKFRNMQGLTDAYDPRNTFEKRAFGGQVTAGRSYIVGDGGQPEVFTPGLSGVVTSSVRGFEEQFLSALQSSAVLGGIFGGIKQKLISQLSSQVSNRYVPDVRGGGQGNDALAKMQMGINVRLVEALERFESMPAEEILTTGARRAPEVIAQANLTSIQRKTPAGQGQMNEYRKGR